MSLSQAAIDSHQPIRRNNQVTTIPLPEWSKRWYRGAMAAIMGWNGRDGYHDKTGDDGLRCQVVQEGRRQQGILRKRHLSRVLHVLLSVATVVLSSSMISTTAVATATDTSASETRLRRRRLRRSSVMVPNNYDHEDDLTAMDLRMCMDMIQMPSTSTTDATISFTSPQVQHLVDHLNDVTEGRFGTYSQLPSSVRTHLWLYAKHKSNEQQHGHQRPTREYGTGQATTVSSSTPSNMTASVLLSYLRPICIHMVHVAQVITIPFQFILQERSLSSTDASTSTLSATGNMANNRNTSSPHHHHQQQHQPKQRNKHESWLSKWQSLAPALIQQHAFQCPSTAASLLEEPVQRHVDDNVFLRNQQPPPQQQQQVPTVDLTTTDSSCPYLVRVIVRDILYHVGTFIAVLDMMRS